MAGGIGEPVTVYDSAGLRKQFPYFRYCETLEGVGGRKNAGHVSARNLLKAQQTVAKQRGCDVMTHVVKALHPIGSEGFLVEMEGQDRPIRAGKILVTTGAFTNARNLLPDQRRLRLDLFGITVLLVSVQS